MISWATNVPNCYAKTMRICADPQCLTYLTQVTSGFAHLSSSILQEDKNGFLSGQLIIDPKVFQESLYLTYES